MQQRQGNLVVRLELEKDIQRLESDLKTLREENEQLQSDKRLVEQQFMDYRVKSEEKITKLRGKTDISLYLFFSFLLHLISLFLLLRSCFL